MPKKRTDENISPQDSKQAALNTMIENLDKAYGKGTVMRLGDRGDMKVDAISTGSIGLDLALGIGGIPRGRIVEIYGPEMSGKTTLSLHMIVSVQRSGGIAGFIDVEHALDPVYAKNIGVDINNLYISQPDSGEQAMEVAEAMIRSGAIDLIVVDSVAALTPKAEIDGEMGDSHVALQARLMSQALRKLTAVISNTKCTVVFINQLREKVGIVFGNPEVTTGGRALKFYASVRLDIRRTETIKSGGAAVGNRVRVRVTKNKVAPPLRETEFDIIYGRGVSWSGELVDLGTAKGIIEKKGAWYGFEGNNFAQGRESAKDYIESNPAFAEMIRARLEEKAAAEAKKEQDAGQQDLPLAGMAYNGEATVSA